MSGGGSRPSAPGAGVNGHEEGYGRGNGFGVNSVVLWDCEGNLVSTDVRRPLSASLQMANIPPRGLALLETRSSNGFRQSDDLLSTNPNPRFRNASSVWKP
ncbi:hypothetical protein NE237_014318 [Protea cynaroides]|uniref:Uncharacterized protein n=1 Tax=Protea cynaroides TaxID=273540 RepID=A0A9Q0JT35_9MAGN|nr:hypothetical protein NE237_014318 [Protea cynaroides]